MNKARPKRVRPTCGCCELLMAPRSFRKYGPPTKRAIAEQVAEFEPEYTVAAARRLDWETELLFRGERLIDRLRQSWELSSWVDEDSAVQPAGGSDFELDVRNDVS